MDLRDIISSIPDSIATVVHVGAGLCKELDAYEELGATNIVLLEPHPGLCAQLESRLTGNAKTSTRNVALNTIAGEVEFHINRIPRFSGLYLPQRLLDVFPNAAHIETCHVEAITLQQLAPAAEASDQSKNLLVLELNGAEHEILSTAREQDLAPFDWIVVHSCRADLFSTPPPAATLNDAFAKLGLATFAFRTPGAPFEIQVAQRSQARKLQELQQELDRTTQALHGARYAREERAGEIDRLQQLEADKAAQIEKLTESLEATTKDSTREIDRLQQLEIDKAAQIEKLTASLDATNKDSTREINRLQQALQQLDKDKASQTAQTQELKQSLETVTQELATAHAQHSDTVARLERAQADAEERFEIQQTEMLERQHLLDREVLKAEAQLELIKDVLLREKAF